VEHILVVDDQQEVCELLREVLADAEHEVSAVRYPEKALPLIAADPRKYDLVVLDLDFGPRHMNGIEALKRMREIDAEIPVIMLSGKGTIASAVEAIKSGALDFLEKDTYLDQHIKVSVQKAERLRAAIAEIRRLRDDNRSLAREAEYYRSRAEEDYQMVGDSAAWRAAVERALKVASLPRPVLVRGERGTGKELIAHTIHRHSPCAKGPFVTVNCAAIAEGLLETELFGQEANAFHNAPFKLGRFDLADRGSLFLDEIGNMSDEFQRKILRVIEYQTFDRMAGTEPVKVEVRVIAATNADLEAAMEQGRFRPDLYDRLAFETVHLPPLRERPEDIEPLALYFMTRFARETGIPEKRLPRESVMALREYHWPGNVRELKAVIERLVYRAEGAVIEPAGVRAELGLPAKGRRRASKSPEKCV
jgi:DNA-binding NtrC family response regulator